MPQDKHTQNAAKIDGTPSRVPGGFPPSLPDLSPLTSHLVKVFLQTVSAGSGISQVCLAEAIPAWISPEDAGGGHGATKAQASSSSGTLRVDRRRTCGSSAGPSWLSRVLFLPQDAWSDAKGQLHMDSQQDYQLLGARRAPEGLYLLFRRAFSTCDPKDYLIEVWHRPHSAVAPLSPIPALGHSSRAILQGLGTASGVGAV